MGKKTKSGIIILIAVVLLSLIFAVPKLTEFDIAPPTGGRLIEVVDLTTGYYQCDADACHVTASLQCDEETGVDVVSFRTTGYTGRISTTWLAIDTVGGTDLECYKAGSLETCDTERFPLVLTQLHGITYRYRSDRDTIVGCMDAGRYYDFERGVGCELSRESIPEYAIDGRELYESESAYTCEWNLCPSSDPNFEYCNLEESAQSAWVHTSEEFELLRGQIVTFSPRNSDNSQISMDKTSMSVERWSTTCSEECQTGSKYCLGRETQTINEFYAHICNQLTEALPSSYEILQDCVRTSEGRYETIYVVNSGSGYQVCDGVDSNVCNVYQSTGECDGQQVCKPFDGSVGQEGVGECQCPDDVLSIGQRQCDGDRYRTVIPDAQGCAMWGVWQTCPRDQVQLVCNTDYDDLTNVCVPPSNSPCEKPSAQCVSTTEIRYCEMDMNSAEYWLDAEVCDTGACSGNYPEAYCTCGNEECDSLSEFSCAGEGTNDYYRCVRNSQGCFELENVAQGSCGSNEVCNNNFCVSCDDGNPCTVDGVDGNSCVHEQIENCCMSVEDCSVRSGYTASCIDNVCQYSEISGFCSDNTDCSGNKICLGHECVCPSSTDFCDESEFGLKVCVGDSAYRECVSDEYGTCFEWSDSISISSPKICVDGLEVCPTQGDYCPSNLEEDDRDRCNVDTNAIEYCVYDIITGCYIWEATQCGSEQVCVKQSPAECKVLTNSILGVSEYGVNDAIENLSIIIDPESVEEYSGLRIEAFLCEAGVSCPEPAENIIQQRVVHTNNYGLATVSFDALSNQRDLQIVAQFGEGNTIQKNIFVKKKLSVDLSSSNLINFVGKTVTVTARVRDSETDQLLNTDLLSFNVMQGDESLSFSTSGTSISFTPTSLGLININVNAELSDYLSDQDSLELSIQDPVTEVKLYLDNKEFNGGSISGGSKELCFEVSEAGDPLDVGEFNIIMKPPVGDSIELNFIKSGDLYCKAFDFTEQGRSYYMDGTIQVFGSGRLPLPVSYTFSLSQASDISTSTSGSKIMIYLTVFGISVVVGFAIYLLFRRKK